ncbi:MAG: IS1380 family transposase [Pirellulales bacterium]
MNTKIRRQLSTRKRAIEERLDKTKFPSQCPVMAASNIQYELSDRQQAIAAGGLGLIHSLVKNLGLDRSINENVPLFKIRLPYAESDHVLNIAYNLLAGGTCLEHLEYRRNDEAYLNALGAQRIPDPTTAGDFCRRHSETSILKLMDVFNEVRRRVWSCQPKAFFDEAIIEADGTMVETQGECKEGIDVNHNGQWGYHPLVVSLANTGEPLYIANRGGSRPSHERAAGWLDRAIDVCRQAGFRQIRLRGDTDFSQTEHLDRWDDDKVLFVFGYDAMPNLYERVDELGHDSWRPLKRKPRYMVQTKSRTRPKNVKQEVVEEREFKDLRLESEYINEFPYRPGACKRDYRMVVLWKAIEVHQGQQYLFDERRCFFYITNDWETPAEDIVTQHANKRCNQENVIQQLKSDVLALTAPVDTFNGNWAYMVMASLAWSLKIWVALLVPEGRGVSSKQHQEKQSLLRMDFSTFRQAMINIPAQVLRSGRRLIYRLMGWNRWQITFYQLWERLQHPLRC